MEKPFVVITIGVALAMLVVIFPYVVSGFYLHRGTSVLQRAMMEQGLNSGRWSELVGQPIGPLRDRVKSHLDVAEWFLDQAVRWDTENLEAYRNLAKIYQIRQDNPADLEVLVQAGDIRPDNPMLHLALGDIYNGLGWAEKAVAEYERGRYGPRIERAIVNYLKLAEWRLKAGDPNSALPLLQQVITLDRGNLYALYHFAKICETLGEGERLLAEETYRRIQPLTPESIEPRQDSRLNKFTAEVIPNLVEENAWSLDSALNVVSLWIWRENLNGAADALEHLLEKYPVEPDLYCHLAQVYQEQGRLGEAIDAAGKAIELEPEYATAYLEIARAHEQQGDLREAIAWYEEYHRLAPEDLLGLKRLVEVYEGLGRINEAALWRERLEQRIDDKRMAVAVLGIGGDEFELGANLIKNGNLEEGDFQLEGWEWVEWIDRDKYERGLFVGKADSFERYEGDVALAIAGIVVEEDSARKPARAGYHGRSVTLEPKTLYLLSFFYKTEGLQNGEASVYLGKDPRVVFPSDFRLPQTDGTWRKAFILGWNDLDEQTEIEPILRIWGEGTVWFDEVRMEAIVLVSEPEGHVTKFKLR